MQLRLFLILALSSSLHAQEKPTEPKPLPIFDGKTLTGWTVHCLPDDQAKTYWSVKNGAIQCDSRNDGKHNYVWLIHEKEFADFELNLKLQCFKAKKGNSGIQVRSRWDSDDSQGWLNGPQIDIHPPAPWRTGFIYDETRGVQHWISPVRPSTQLSEKQAFPDGLPDGWKFHFATEENDLWNDLKIRCIGTQITTWLNGVQITDFDGSKVLTDEHHQKAKVGMSGHIALQLHARDQLLIRFKDITVLAYSKK